MSGKLKSLAGALAAAGVALGTVAVSAPSAQAAQVTGMGSCPASQVCAWQHPDFRGYMGHAVGNDKNWNNRIENRDSSWYNNGTGTGNTSVRIYTMKKYQGDYFCLDKGEYDNYDSDWSDKGSSHLWVNPSDC